MAAQITRRSALTGLLAGSGLLASGLSRLSFAAPSAAPGAAADDEHAQARLVFVILRGGMDGLSAVPAYGDADFINARRQLAIAAPGSPGAALELDGFFGLNPRLSHLHALYGAGAMLVVHAVCSPHRARSHFDGQNVLETGATVPFAMNSGWLNRALEPRATPASSVNAPWVHAPWLHAPSVRANVAGVALSSAVPLALRGRVPVTSWSPSHLPSPQADLVARVSAMYEQDAGLANAFTQAQSAHGLMADVSGQANLVEMMGAAGTFLSTADGPRVAMLESPGWDSHAMQAQPLGGLYRNLSALDRGVAQLQASLGAHWANTAVIIASEFGRTVAMNGTAGTDHGTGGAMFLLGGAVQGKRVIADWPGLAVAQRFEGRDLRTTTDMRSVLKGVLHDHLHVADAHLEANVFPDSAGAKRMQGLLRAGSATV